MAQLIVNQNRIGPILGRHPWVFSGALKQIPEGLTSGQPVQLFDESGRFLAQGYFNSYSQMAVRLWSWDEKEEINGEFFVKRISAALKLRQDYITNKNTDAYRLINSESDLLPGLVVDKYGDYLCIQFHNRGIEFWKKDIVATLVKVIKPKGIYERSDVGGRKSPVIPAPDLSFPRKRESSQGQAPAGIQGDVILSKAKDLDAGNVGVLFGDVPEKIKILENGYKFYVDIINGQKTGFFLDQRDKRQALSKYAGGKKVLNCFSYTGGFSVYALAAGAKKVVSVDASAGALELAEENVKLNKLDSKKCEFICADVKDYLYNPPEKDFDLIILDPPAFVKDRHKVHEGLQGYRKINEAALRLLPPGGILVTASCSTHVSMVDFRHMLSEAAGRAGRVVQILEVYTHGIDHPELAAFTEGEYLKCIFALVK